MPHFRLVHAVSSAPSVDIRINGKKLISNLSYTEITSYLPTSEHKVTVDVYPFDSGNLLYTRRISLHAEYSTLVVTTADSKLRVQGYKDTHYVKDEGYALIRLIHLAQGAPPVNLNIDGKSFLPKVSYLESKESLLRLGNFFNTAEVKLDLLGGATVVGPAVITPGNKTVHTLFLFGAGSIESITHKLVNDNGPIHDKLVEPFDTVAYMNGWFLGAEIPQPYSGGRCAQQSAVYTPLEDGVKVFNRCYDEAGKVIESVTGKAVVVNPEQPAALRVSFPNTPEFGTPNDNANYLVVEFDKHPRHGFAFVYSPNRASCYLLLRERKLSDTLYQSFVKRARHSGFEADKIVRYLYNN